jgi:hypothetical protein
MAGVRFPVTASFFSLLHGALGPTQRFIQWIPGGGGIFPEVKWQGREADLSLSSSAKVKNDGAVPSLLHMFSWRGA